MRAVSLMLIKVVFHMYAAGFYNRIQSFPELSYCTIN